MEPFKITCVTCRAVLTVRKESMLGQIIACPRCSMMVQILPPAQSSAASALDAPQTPALQAPAVQAKKANVARSAEPLAKSHESSAAIAPTATSPTTTHAPPHAEPVAAVLFDDAVEAVLDRPPAEPAACATAKTAVAAPLLAEHPASRWGAYKFAVMIVGGAIAGAGLAATALTLFAPQSEPSAMAAAHPAPPAGKPTDFPQTAEQVHSARPMDPGQPAGGRLSAVEPLRKGSLDAQPSIKNSADSQAIPPQASDKTVESKITADDDEPADDTLHVPAAVDVAAAPTTPVDEAVVVADRKNKEAPTEPDAAAPRLRIDPLEIDPEGLNLTIIRNGPPKDPFAESQLPADDSPAPSADDVEANPNDDAELPAAHNADLGAVRRDEQPRLAPPADVEALLARRLPGLKVDKMPLCRLLDLAVQISDLPVSVAPEQLRMAAVSVGQPVSADVRDATLEEFLAAALKPLRLRPIVADEHIVVVRASDDRNRSITYAVDDLASDAAAVQRLAESIERLVAPESWQSAGGQGTMAIEGSDLRIEQLESTHYEILLLLERCRAALELPLRSKYPAALVAAEPPAVALVERLNGTATFTFSRYTPLREIFRHWQEETDVAVLVDWPALAQLQLRPNVRIACSAADKRWDEALDGVLQPLGLAWRPIDRRAIEITTLEKAQTDPLLEAYRLEPAATAAFGNLAMEVEKVAAAANNGADVGSEAAAIVYDADHALLLVRQPAAAQRQIAAWLAAQKLLPVNSSASN